MYILAKDRRRTLQISSSTLTLTVKSLTDTSWGVISVNTYFNKKVNILITNIKWNYNDGIKNDLIKMLVPNDVNTKDVYLCIDDKDTTNYAYTVLTNTSEGHNSDYAWDTYYEDLLEFTDNIEDYNITIAQEG